MNETNHSTFKVLERPFLSSSVFSQLKGPTAYPFDQYLVLGDISKDILLCKGKEEYPIPSRLHVTTNLPGYISTKATRGELEEWPTLVSTMPDILTRAVQIASPEVKEQLSGPPYYDKDLWNNQRIAFIIRRPVFLQRMTILLILITAVSTVVLAVSSKREDMAKNFAGSLLTIWTVRSLLNLNGPRTPGLTDYSAIMLFAGLALIYIFRYLWSSGQTESEGSTN